MLMTELPKATSIVLADTASLMAPSPAREHEKILEVLSYIYKNKSRTPQKLRANIYKTCMKERTKNRKCS
ncbi:MAG: hypothetical protein ACYC75_01325 [Minisyncoccota bacterium]